MSNIDYIDKSFYERLGNNIRNRRNQMDMTQEQLAKAVYSSRPTISDLENGKKESTDFFMIWRIAEALECSVDYLTEKDKSTTHDAQGVQNYTGLPEESIKILHSYSNAINTYKKSNKEANNHKKVTQKALDSSRMLDAINDFITSPVLANLMTQYIGFSEIEYLFIGNKNLLGQESSTSDLAFFTADDGINVNIDHYNGKSRIFINGDPDYEITEESMQQVIMRKIQKELDRIKENLEKQYKTSSPFRKGNQKRTNK